MSPLTKSMIKDDVGGDFLLLFVYRMDLGDEQVSEI